MISWATLCVCALILFGVASVWRTYAARQMRARELVSVAARCTNAQGQASILVLLAPVPHVHAAARALHSIFDRAECPFRVRVALYDAAPLNAAPTVSVLDAYTTFVRANTARFDATTHNFADRIVVVRPSSRVALSANSSTHAIRALLLHTAYRGEAFVATLTAHAEMVSGWDTAALEALAACRNPHALLAAPPAFALTASEAAEAMQRAHAVTAARRAAGVDGWDLIADAFANTTAAARVALTSTAATGTTTTGGAATGPAAIAQSSLLPRFSVTAPGTFTSVPRVLSRAFARSSAVPAPQPALWWTGECCFAPARAFVRDEHHAQTQTQTQLVQWTGLPPFPVPFDNTLSQLPNDLENALVSARLWCAGWDFYAPTCVLSVMQDGSALAFASASASASGDAIVSNVLAGVRSYRIASRSLDDWQRFVSVNLAQRVVGGRAVMGATANPSQDEIVAKFDSQKMYANERDAFV